jgi:hypothetical protein
MEANEFETLEQELPPVVDPDPLDDPIEVTPEEIIDAFEAVYEELVMLRNSVINLHERLEKLETPSNVSS